LRARGSLNGGYLEDGDNEHIRGLTNWRLPRLQEGIKAGRLLSFEDELLGFMCGLSKAAKVLDQAIHPEVASKMLTGTFTSFEQLAHASERVSCGRPNDNRAMSLADGRARRASH
jgi:hypothetical protein